MPTVIPSLKTTIENRPNWSRIVLQQSKRLRNSTDNFHIGPLFEGLPQYGDYFASLKSSESKFMTISRLFGWNALPKKSQINFFQMLNIRADEGFFLNLIFNITELIKQTCVGRRPCRGACALLGTPFSRRVCQTCRRSDGCPTGWRAWRTHCTGTSRRRACSHARLPSSCSELRSSPHGTLWRKG